MNQQVSYQLEVDQKLAKSALLAIYLSGNV